MPSDTVKMRGGRNQDGEPPPPVGRSGFRAVKECLSGFDETANGGDSRVLEIRCPSCATAYSVPADRVGPGGRRVRCARCGTFWRAMADGSAADDAAPAALGDGRDGIAFSSSVDPPSVEPTLGELTALSGDVGAEASVQSEPDWRGIGAAVAVASSAITAPLPGVARRRQVIDAVPAGFQPPKRPQAAPGKRAAVAAKAGPPITEVAGPWVLAAAAAMLIGAFAFRAPIVSAIPDFARLYASVGLPVNLRGLEFRAVTATRDIENGAPVMIVQGTIANVSGTEAPLPPIRIALRNGGQEVYAWMVEPSRPSLGAGLSAPFRARLASPPASADGVMVMFGEQRQTAAIGK